MKLAELLESIDGYELHGDAGVDICSLACDSRAVSPGSLFFAFSGSSADGHDYISAALENGASAIILENSSKAPSGVPWVEVADGRGSMALIAAFFYGNPTSALPLIGITGTNGKTTTTYLLEAILAAAGIPSAVLGTISYRFGNKRIEASHTTPDAIELQKIMRELADDGAKAFVMEVSSHALEQKRVDGCRFDAGIFSNLTRDHLDYHGTMEDYLAAKLRLFTDLLRPDAEKPVRRGVVNLDDPYGATVASSAACPVITFGMKDADVRCLDATFSVDGTRAKLMTPFGELVFASPLLGLFNLYNIMASIAAGIALGIPLDAVKRGIEDHQTVPGRLERVKNSRGVTLLVDYAHTGDALQNVLSTIRNLNPPRVITLFGCGGDRDPGKRPIMGKIAAEYSDLAIATSDNPRTEDPFVILSQIREGMAETEGREYSPEELDVRFCEKGYLTMENRREAIKLAARVAQAGDVVLLAGKGHEDYQIIGRVKHHFDDREEAAEAFK